MILVQRPQHKNTSDPVEAPKTIHLSLFVIEFGDTKKYCTFSGREFSHERQKKANWRSQLHAQKSKMHSNPLGPSEKNSFC